MTRRRWTLFLIPNVRRYALLTAIYAGSTIVFLAVYLDPIWAGASALLCVASAAGWWVRASESTLRTGKAGPIQAAVERVGSRPILYLALPLAVMTSWFAAQIALDRPPNGSYWTPFYIWVAAIALFVSLLLPWRSILQRPNLGRMKGSVPWLEVSAIAFLTLVAFVVRAYNLDEPNPFSGDEAHFANQALEVTQGTFTNMFRTGQPFGQPSMYYFLLAGVFEVFGVSVAAARAPSVLFGVTMVPLLYLLLRELFDDRRVALVGAAFLAVYHLHIHFSRLALNNISAAWVAVLTFYFAARATRTQKPLDFGLAGAAAGLSLYTFVGGRTVPIVLGLYFAWVVLMNRRFLRDNLGHVLVLLAGFAVVALPQGIFFISDQPDEFYASHRWANIFANGWLEETAAARGDGRLTILFEQAKDSIRALGFEAERYHHYNPGQPLIDVVARWLFFIGAGVALYRIRRPGSFMFLSLLILTIVLGAVVVFPPVSSARLVTMTPAVAAFVAIGLVALVDLAVRLNPRLKRFTPIVLAAVVIAFAVVNLQFYFGTYLPGDRYVNNPGSLGNNTVTYAAGDYMAELGPAYAAYWFGEPQIYTSDPTMRFLGRDRTFVDVERGWLQLPDLGLSEPHATFMFLEDRRSESEAIVTACPGGSWREFSDDMSGRVMFSAYESEKAPLCLAAAGLFQVSPTRSIADLATAAVRDTERADDLATIAAALNRHFAEDGVYPTTNGSLQTLCVYADDAGCALSAYLDEIPIDPNGNAVHDGYFYASDGGRFSLFAETEAGADPLGDDCFFRAQYAGRAKPALCLSGSG